MDDSLIFVLKQLHCGMERWERAQDRTDPQRLSGAQRAILLYLFAQRDREVYAVDLHAALGLSRSSISSALKALERRGYLTVLKDPADDRKKRLVLSDAACRLEAQLRQQQRQREQGLCQGISPGQLAEIRQGLKIMLGNLKAAPSTQKEEPFHA